jgi:oxygen-dependent protoporphyrinogen oxidase
MNRIVIVGGGIAGLSIAHAIRAQEPGCEVLVLERGTQPGGNVRTEVIDGYTCEYGPDGFLDNAPATLKLVSEVGLDERICPSRDAARRRFIFLNGRLREVPTSPLAFLTTGLLSVRGKLRVAGEPFAKARPHDDETIRAFAARRIGREAADVLIDSMVSGIFAGDAAELSLRACFPRMWEMETEYGGLFKALLALRKRRKAGDPVGSPAGRLTSFKSGMEELIRGVAASLGPQVVRTSTSVFALRRGRGFRPYRPGTHSGYSLLTSDGTIEGDAIIFAGPSAAAADMVRPFDAPLAGLLSGIMTAPLVVVCLGYDESALAADRGPLNGFGFLVPRKEGVRSLGALWETTIYPNRAPAGKALLRVMIGGARDREAVELDDHSLVQTVRADLERTMGLRIVPEFVHVIRHTRGIPQYTIGHVDRLERIETLLATHPGLFLAGNSYRGVAINSCVTEAPAIAARALEYLREREMPNEAPRRSLAAS